MLRRIAEFQEVVTPCRAIGSEERHDHAEAPQRPPRRVRASWKATVNTGQLLFAALDDLRCIRWRQVFSADPAPTIASMCCTREQRPAGLHCRQSRPLDIHQLDVVTVTAKVGGVERQ